MPSNYRRYDPRLKNLVAESKDISKFVMLGIPKSTLRQWVKDGVREYFSIPELDKASSDLIQENLDLKKRLACVEAEKQLIGRTIRVFGFQIQYLRLPAKDSKSEIIAAVCEATKFISLTTALEVIGLSMARYFHWIKRQVHCTLQDESSCPRRSRFLRNTIE